MAKIEGTQSIPSELLDGYRQLLTEKTPDGIVRGRYPYRLPKLQDIDGNPSPGQRIQRDRFKQAIAKFKTLPAASRSRWYDAEPSTGSFLWYYDYFILSAIMSVTGLPGGAIAVIKGIKYYEMTAPSGSPANFGASINTVDPNKAVAMIFGAGIWQVAEGAAVPVYPYPVTIGSNTIILKMSQFIDYSAGVGALIIEYI
jgi:hypothetical protein